MLPRYEAAPDPSCKEKLPEIRSLGRHPWEITLREFIETVRRNYGIEIDPAAAAVAGGQFLHKGRRFYPVEVLDLDEPLPLSALQSFCRLYRIPPEDWGLYPEED
ncbi:MAG TPA: hypothetical protein VF789_02150 [Thermoanaerobaculia bacterium]